MLPLTVKNEEKCRDFWKTLMPYQHPKTKLGRFTRLLINASLLCFCASMPIHSYAENAETEKKWTINQKNADIREFIAQVASITGQTIIIDPRIKSMNNVTVVSSTPLSKEEIYDVFLSVLQANGFTAVPQGKTLNIVPINRAKSDAPEFAPNTKPNSGTMITRVVELINLSAVELIPVIRPLIPQYGHAAAIASSNSIIISDHVSNVNRLAKLIREMDMAESTNFDIIKLEHAWVGDLVKVIKESLLGKQKNRKLSGELIADERTNRLLVTGKPQFRQQVRRLAKAMDVASEATSLTRVIHLRHADAEKLAETLADLTKSLSGSVAGGKDSKESKQVAVKADVDNNALIIAAAPELVREIENIVRKLDVRRAQVLIEAAIVEVSGSINEALGIQWGIDGTKTSSGNDSAKSSITGAILDNSKISIGSVALRNSNFGVLVNALTTTANSNLLSTPSIMTLDNEEAEILVGQEVPFETGSYTTDSSGSSNPFTTTERKDVGVRLKVTPHINEGETLRLEVDQEISAVVPSSESGVDGLVTNKRTIKSTIQVNNNETIVLGGLVQDDVSQSESAVPFLSSIPLLGRLFENDKDSHTKRNLMVFIKTSIVLNEHENASLTDDKYSSIKMVRNKLDKKSEKFKLDRVLPQDASGLFDSPQKRQQGSSNKPTIWQDPAPAARRGVSSSQAQSSTTVANGGPGWGVQLASYRSANAAQQAASKIQSQHSQLLGGLTSEVKESNMGSKGVYYRVVFSGLNDRRQAQTLCRQLQAAKQGCLDIRN
ncbi:type II secretion system secretin GspD [Zooshikella ganghwensis]|uniref:Type II secretion system protein GspD n=1 Tax=Zooshikella ganghwensis TaxID=202772 RepID=A0A4P9VPK6_9GAMM|nr:type II secretion system secretin GspD [Zooshikella ganghwensis]RDH44876.1 type II secretion system protein GspD [Zooshikella ganghwensis]